ncbi:MAG TPA: M15 family metallopeptidase [Acidimicrobiales bacterium]|nr:M15 family metallopeptidase [Acidimicrobiales bacterium]
MLGGSPRRRPALVGLCVALLAALVAVADPGAGAAGDARAERERVRREQAQAAAALDVLRAEDAQVDAALRAMNAEIVAQEGALANAEAQVRRAEEEVAAALAAEAEIAGRVALLEGALRDMAVQEFITGGRLRLELLTPEGDDLGEWARRNALAGFAIGSATDTGDALRQAQEDRMVARQRAQAASADVARHRDEVATRLQTVTVARDEQAAFAERLDARIESRLAESALLASRDRQLSDQIAAEQAALAARAAAARRAGTGAGRSSPAPVRGNVPLRTVQGITVHADIADNLAALLDAAAGDGVPLSGWGYRDPADQQRLREAHCPDPARSPAASCRPPTARPGHSMHERGLAVDFTYQGRTVSSSSVAYRWLTANAGRYGFRNLPGEPWHWSTNGN